MDSNKQVCSEYNVFPVGCDVLNLVIFACKLTTGDIFHYLLHCGWLFSPNSDNPIIGSVPWTIVILLIYVGHVIKTTIIINDDNCSFPCWKSYYYFNGDIFNVVVIREIIFIVGIANFSLPLNILEPGDHYLPNLLLRSSNFSDEQYLSFLVCGSHHLIVALLLV